MNERERLVELLKDNQGDSTYYMTDEAVQSVSDVLLENGVVVLPCKIGTHLFRVTYPYRKKPKVTKYTVTNFRTFGKKHKIQVEVQALNVPIKNWMNYSDFYKTKEEAEKALKGGAE